MHKVTTPLPYMGLDDYTKSGLNIPKMAFAYVYYETFLKHMDLNDENK